MLLAIKTYNCKKLSRVQVNIETLLGKSCYDAIITKTQRQINNFPIGVATTAAAENT